jgi:DNA repair exonuclease SbcCD nuclease subunit
MAVKVAHIADIHIKNNDTDFSELYTSLKINKPDVIVIAGDVIDSVINIDAVIILDVVSFLISLTNISPVILVPGNHDLKCNINNIDFFSVITKDHEILKPPKFNYWKHSGIYNFMDINWNVVSNIEHVPEFEFSTQMQVLIFHENLDRFDLESFHLYNAIMGGHIHKRQLIAPNAAYAGSLFQQSIKESHTDHGYILWKLENNNTSHKFINIKNYNIYLKVEIENSKDITKNLPTNVLYYDIYHDNTMDIDKIIEQYNILYLKSPRRIVNKNKYSFNSIYTNDINDINLHIKLITDQLGKDHKYLDDVINMHKSCYVPDNNEPINEKITLISLEFENMYNYNCYNKIDFEPMSNQLSGIIANNNSGKTSVIDIILFALFDIHPRISKKQYIVNVDKDSFYVSLKFKINEIEGSILKSTNVCTFMFNDKNLTQPTIPRTLTAIKQIVGTFNDNSLTSIQLQNNSTNFINMSSLMRRQRLTDLLSLKLFNNIDEELTKKITDVSNKIKNITIKSLECEFDNDILQKLEMSYKYKNIINQLISDKTKEEVNDKEELNSIENNSIYDKLNELYELYDNKKILLGIIEENKHLLQNFNVNVINSIYEQKEVIREELIEINNVFSSCNEKIKETVITKYQNNGINYLYKLCGAKSDGNEILYESIGASLLLLQRDHKIKIDTVLNLTLLNCNQSSNVLKYIRTVELIDNRISELVRSITIDQLNELSNTDGLLTKLNNQNIFTLNEEHKVDITNLNKQLEILKLYKQLIKPNVGIINSLLLSLKNDIERAVNKLLEYISLKISIDDSYNILYYVTENKLLDVSLLSGYQKFILNIIFRIVLWKFSDVPLLNALIVDEGFGSCDMINIDIIVNMLRDLVRSKDTPAIFIIISHNNELINSIEYPLFILPTNKIVTDRPKTHFLKENVSTNISSESSESSECSTTQSNTFYCSYCNVTLKSISKQKHLLSIRHSKNTNNI